MIGAPLLICDVGSKQPNDKRGESFENVGGVPVDYVGVHIDILGHDWQGWLVAMAQRRRKLKPLDPLTRYAFPRTSHTSAATSDSFCYRFGTRRGPANFLWARFYRVRGPARAPRVRIQADKLGRRVGCTLLLV